MFLSGVTTNDCIVFFTYGYKEISAIIDEILQDVVYDYEFQVTPDASMIDSLYYNNNILPCTTYDLVTSTGGWSAYFSSGTPRATWSSIWNGANPQGKCQIYIEFPSPVSITSISIAGWSCIGSGLIIFRTYNNNISPDNFDVFYQEYNQAYATGGVRTDTGSFDGSLVTGIAVQVSTGSGIARIGNVSVNC